jgi:transcriptional regulator with XRE-family HTH domain
MKSNLGKEIRDARTSMGLSLRGLARAVEKSPAYLNMLETGDPPPAVAEETLRRIASVLALDPDRLLTLAGRTPSDVAPSDELEVSIFREVKRLDRDAQEALLSYLKQS